MYRSIVIYVHAFVCVYVYDLRSDLTKWYWFDVWVCVCGGASVYERMRAHNICWNVGLIQEAMGGDTITSILSVSTGTQN